MTSPATLAALQLCFPLHCSEGGEVNSGFLLLGGGAVTLPLCAAEWERSRLFMCHKSLYGFGVQSR